MALKNAIRAMSGLALAVIGTGATLAYFEESIPMSLNPLYAKTMADHRAQELIFDRLWYNDAVTNELKSRVVQKYQVAEAGRAVEITLKSGIRWHNGQAMTAKDLCFTVKAMLDPRTPSPVAAHYRDFITGCDTKGPQAALIRFDRVLPNPRERLGFPILPASEFSSTAISPDLQFSARPIGTGPFNGKRGLRMVTFDAFANAHRSPKVVQMQLQEGGDPLVQTKTLVNNNVQGIVVVPPPQRPDLRASDDVQMKAYDLRSWWYIAVNPNKKALSDPKVRQALNSVINRNELRQFSLGVKADDKNSPCEFISGPFISASPYYNSEVKVSPEANLAKADSLLKAAGLVKTGGRWHINGEPITLRVGMLANLDREAPDLLSQVANQLGAAGFDRLTSKISADEWDNTVMAGNSDFDLVIGKWSFGLVEEVNDLFHSKGRQNLFRYKNDQVDAILAEYDDAVTDTEQRDAYHKLHKALSIDLPYLFLWKLDTKSAWRTELNGVTIAPYHYFTEIDAWSVGG
jgi:peptide/nickel transport system substrate-binding protein